MIHSATVNLVAQKNIIMAYLLLANIFFLIELTIECCWIWINVPTAWISLRLPIPIPIKLKTGESLVEVPMPPTVHTGFMGWLTDGTGLEVISHDGDRPGMAGPFPVRFWMFCLIVAYPFLLLDYLIRVFGCLLQLLALVVISLLVWSLWNCGINGVNWWGLWTL